MRRADQQGSEHSMQSPGTLDATRNGEAGNGTDGFDRLVKGVVHFQKQAYPERQDQFRRLAAGQQPHTIFITCADSRVVPEMITTRPGATRCPWLGLLPTVPRLPAPATASGGSCDRLSAASARPHPPFGGAVHRGAVRLGHLCHRPVRRLAAALGGSGQPAARAARQRPGDYCVFR